MKSLIRNAFGVRSTLMTDSDRPYSPVVHTQQDVEPIIESVNRDREIMKNNGANKVVARVPMIVYQRSIEENWDEDDWKKYLNSDDCKPFRIWQGRV